MTPHVHDPRREIKVRDLPGDVQIDAAIRKLFGSTKCLDDQIRRKVDRAIREGKIKT